MRSAELLVPPTRLGRWLENFARRHALEGGQGGCHLSVADGGLCGRADDGSTFVARAPFGRSFAGPADVDSFRDVLEPPAAWGVVLVRKGGFAVARMAGGTIAESKVGQRHVQGRTKAGGQSQQRFARRRDNQARQAYAAAADHAARILGPLEEALRTAGEHPEVVVVTGGDHDGVQAVLSDPRLRELSGRVVEPFLPVPDPRRSVLESAISDAGSVRMWVTNA